MSSVESVQKSPLLVQDDSLWMLLATNVLAIAVALWQGWSLQSLMVVYWLQSVAIGVSNVARIRSLENFSTSGLKMNGKSVEPTEATKRSVANFFAFHYGFFHVVYLVFLLVGKDANAFGSWLLICGAGFAANHYFSYRTNREADRQGCPNVGTLMFLPYLRIFPMHLCIVFGLLLSNGVFGVLVFSLLKTLADVALHLIEHRILRSGSKVSEKVDRGLPTN